MSGRGPQNNESRFRDIYVGKSNSAYLSNTFLLVW